MPTYRYDITIEVCTVGIYAIRHIASGDCYVGRSHFIEGRWAEHRARLEAGRHFNPLLQAAFNRYGLDAFEWIILEECVRDLVFEKERQWIEKLRPAFNRQKKCK